MSDWALEQVEIDKEPVGSMYFTSMSLNPMQQVMLTVLLGPEDPTAWKRYKKQAKEKRAYPRHRNKKLARNAKRYQERGEQIREQSRLWRLNNPEKVVENNRAWRAKNPGKVWAGLRAWVVNRRKTDPTFHLLDCMRSRLREALKNIKKAGHTQELVGCSKLELMAHIEARFVPGMTWENYGPVWHVDHIRPCASFDFSDPAQQRECFHFTNLQPLWAGDNRRKSDKWVEV